MLIKRFTSQLLEQIYFSLFFFFVIAIPGAFINFLILGFPEENRNYTAFHIIGSTLVSLSTFLLAPLVYGFFIQKIKGFLSHKQLKFKLVYSKTKEPVKPRHYIVRSYVRFFLFPIVAFTFIPYFLPLIISNGKRTAFDYILGTEAEVVK